MLKEALEYLTGLNRKATAPVLLDLHDPRSKSYVIDGEIHKIALDPEPRNHLPKTLGDLISLANRFEEADVGDLPHACSVWFNDEAVHLVIDDSDRVDSAGFILKKSEAFEAVEKLQRGEWLEQKPFVRLLRIDLAGTLEPRHLLDKVRRVSFEATSTGEVRHGRESLGKEILQRVQTPEQELPEEVTLLVPIYSNPGEREPQPIRCAVEVDPARGAFRLVPLPDQITRAVQAHIESIGERLSQGLKTQWLYQGRP